VAKAATKEGGETRGVLGGVALPRDRHCGAGVPPARNLVARVGAVVSPAPSRPEAAVNAPGLLPITEPSCWTARARRPRLLFNCGRGGLISRRRIDPCGGALACPDGFTEPCGPVVGERRIGKRGLPPLLERVGFVVVAGEEYGARHGSYPRCPSNSQPSFMSLQSFTSYSAYSSYPAYRSYSSSILHPFPLNALLKIIRIHLLHRIHRHHRHTHIMIYHQLRQLFTVNQHNLAPYLRHVPQRIPRKLRCRDEDTLVRPLTL